MNDMKKMEDKICVLHSKNHKELQKSKRRSTIGELGIFNDDVHDDDDHGDHDGDDHDDRDGGGHDDHDDGGHGVHDDGDDALLPCLHPV
ncbi:hypothetical protein CEXT_737831 [Caerostris extrusa]|uniref:Uncharacterized protein n=1 Tax=Caerostris extrusa TaxID=172846 RepID=A0AAV4XXK7_CAEEX|nr:hypothetical protein CEXT_737831 [Caerostris extrusa]